MPNISVPAAATGLPEDTDGPFTRRSLLAGLAGATIAAAAPAVAAAAPDDPALDLVARCRAADAEYDRLSKGKPVDFDYDALADETWGPVFPLLRDAPAATTAAGAIAMLERVLEADLTIAPGAAMIESALAFLRPLAGRVA